MDSELSKGVVLYHKNGRIKAEILELDDKLIRVKLHEKIDNKNELTLLISSIGEWLFFKEDDIELSFELLIDKPEYLRYGNSKLIDAQARRRKSIDDRMRMLMANKISSEFKSKLLQHLKDNFLFDGFYHYTDFPNFISIMRAGKLLSRNGAKKYGFHDAAEQSVIAKTPVKVKNYARFYYKEKTPTFYINEGIKVDNSPPHMAIPVIMVFNEDVIFNKDVAFLSGCGGSTCSKYTTSAEDALQFDWPTVFSRGPMSEDEKRYVKNKRNAEFLMLNEVCTSNIKRIIFRSPADKKSAEHILGKNNLFELDSKREKFNYNNSFVYDYDIVVLDNVFDLALVFHSYYDNYTHEVKVVYRDGITDTFNPIAQNPRKLDLPKPAHYNNCQMYFRFATLPYRKIRRIEYYMHGHRSAVWEDLNA